MASSKQRPRKPLRASKRARRYGATVHALVATDLAGLAVKALEHAPEIQVMNFGKRDKDPDITKITLRSLEFPRFWDGAEVDIFGDTSRGLVVVQHPPMEEEEESPL